MPQPTQKRYLKSVEGEPGQGGTVTYTNGTTSTDITVGKFFMLAQDRNWDAQEVKSKIQIGRMCDPFTDWDEAQRIIGTFVAQAQRRKA